MRAELADVLAHQGRAYGTLWLNELLCGLPTSPQTCSLQPCDQRLTGPGLAVLASGWWGHPVVKAVCMGGRVLWWGWAAPSFGQNFKADDDG
jgi:hypothetical protein